MTVPWQILDKVQDSRNTGAATGKTISPENEFETVVVLLIQRRADGAVTNLACGMGPPTTFEEKGNGRNTWSLNVQKVPGMRPIRRGDAIGISLVRRPGGTLEPWVTRGITVE